MIRFRLRLWFVVVLWGTVAPGRAEALWLVPERFAATPGASLRASVAAGETFAPEASPVAARRVREFGGILTGDPLVNTAVAANGDPAARFSVTLTRPGIALLTVALKPELREIARPDVERHLREIHATDELRATWDDMVTADSWRETRAVRLKTYVRVGEPPADDRTWAQPSDGGLDIVPQRDPTASRVDDACSVLVTDAARPVVGAVVSFLSSGETREHVVVTDDHGRATAKLDAAGPWLIQTMALRRDGATRREWRAYVVALTLEAR